MNEAMRLLQHVPAWIRDLHLNPWLVTIGAGLVAAFLEQRMAGRRAPQFTADHEGAATATPPGKPR